MNNIVRSAVPLLGLVMCGCSGSPTSYSPLAPSILGNPTPGPIPLIVDSEPVTGLPRPERGVCWVDTSGSDEPVWTTMPVRDGDQPCVRLVRLTID